IAPRDQIAVLVGSALEVVMSGATEDVVAQIVFTRPAQLHRLPDDLGDRDRIADVVVAETPAEAAAHTRQMQRDVRLLHAGNACRDLPAASRLLRAGPQFELAVAE